MNMPEHQLRVQPFMEKPLNFHQSCGVCTISQHAARSKEFASDRASDRCNREAHVEVSVGCALCRPRLASVQRLEVSVAQHHHNGMTPSNRMQFAVSSTNASCSHCLAREINSSSCLALSVGSNSAISLSEGRISSAQSNSFPHHQSQRFTAPACCPRFAPHLGLAARER